mgnify:CR=1 FL=1
MKRQQAVSKASKFLGKKGYIKTKKSAKRIKDQARNNPDLNRASLNQIVADIFQRNADPKDLDLQKIDFSNSYGNIRSQVQSLLDEKGYDKFENRKDRERESQMSYAAEKQSEILKDIAEVRDERRDNFNQFIDKTKNTKKRFGRLTEEAYEKWSRNPSKFDVEGVDTRNEGELRGMEVRLPFEKKERIRDMAVSDAVEKKFSAMEGSVSEKPLAIKGGKDPEQVGVSESSSVDAGLQDSRSSSQVEKNVRGSTSERSSQKGLREQGFASKSSEKTLDKFEGNYT